MNFKNRVCLIICFLFAAYPILCSTLSAQEIFIYRPDLEKKLLDSKNRISLHGEYFANLLYPGTFPSFNDLTGPEDRWTFGFKNILFLTSGTTFVAQLVTHDDGGMRTKFDWHFSLQQRIHKNAALIFGHDSNHDSDYESIINGKTYYLNRNYVGLGLPIEHNSFFIEPFTWFFHHSNQKNHLDMSGEKLKQEYGIRIGYWYQPSVTFNFQAIAQTDKLFSQGQSLLADLIIRIRLVNFLELSLGARIWMDIKESRLSNKKKYYQIMWGIAVPF
jgi:hypothetical protein